MKKLLFILAVVCALHTSAQSTGRSAREMSPIVENRLEGYVVKNSVMDARRISHPPIFRFGTDSLQRFYFSHFTGFDSVLTKSIDRGDTAKYIRVYFSFTIDERGSAYDPHFERITSTRYAKSQASKPIEYFDADKAYYQEVIKQMIHKMPFWAPGLADIKNSNSMMPVESQVLDYIQFWVGINPPQN